MTRLAAASARQQAGRTVRHGAGHVFSPPDPITRTPDCALILGGNHPNTLIVGPDGAPDALLHAVAGFLPRPVFVWPDDGSPWRSRTPFRTLVLRRLSALGADDQATLLSWIEGPGAGVQIISMATRMPYASVERGTFLEALYYRLNIVCLRCQPHRPRKRIRQRER